MPKPPKKQVQAVGSTENAIGLNLNMKVYHKNANANYSR